MVTGIPRLKTNLVHIVYTKNSLSIQGLGPSLDIRDILDIWISGLQLSCEVGLKQSRCIVAISHPPSIDPSDLGAAIEAG